MKIKTGSLSEGILISLEKTIDGYVRLEDFAYNSWKYAYGDASILKKSALSQAVKRLRERGLLTIEKKTDEEAVLFKLTSLGKESLGYIDEKQWDGKWRIILFDIPEKQKVTRNVLRRRLREWDFELWQQSVWITKRNITSKLRKLIIDLKIDNWVVVIESEDPAINHILLNGRSS